MKNFSKLQFSFKTTYGQRSNSQLHCSILRILSKGYLKKENTPCDGGVAQLGEHLLCKQGVRGSIPLISTKRWAHSSAG